MTNDAPVEPALNENAPAIVDDEFKALIPPLTPEERSQLEKNLLQDGCIQPLVVWRKTGLLLDGHNRLEICHLHGIKYDTVGVALDGRDDAKAWIICNQFGRRNLAPYQRAELALALEPLIRAKAKEKQRETGKTVGRGQGKVLANLPKPIDTRKEVARAAGLGERTIANAKVIKERASEETKVALRRGETTINREFTAIKRADKDAKREAKNQANAEIIQQNPTIESAIESGAKYSTIVIDPPWDFSDEGDHSQFGRGRPTYQTLTIDELKTLPVGKFADTDCHIYLWITNRSLPKGFDLLEAWGFRYIVCLTWCKPSIGMGNYFRGSSEQVLFGVKGSLPLKRKDVGTWFHAERGKGGHSSKPEEFYRLVESCSPEPYLELFARCERKGWSVWGGEVSAT